MNVSIIIVSYDCRDYLDKCLSAVLAQGLPSDMEVIVVDNASGDDTTGLLRRKYPEVRLIASRVNLGFAEANNMAAREARGRYLALLNPDTVPSEGWLMPLVETLDAHPGAAASGSRLLMMDSPSRINSAGAAITFFGSGYDIGFGDLDGPAYAEPRPVAALSAASMLIRREEFLAMGGFDARHFMYFEDVDLSWRLLLQGGTLLYEPRSIVYHKVGGSSGAARHSAIRVLYGTRNSLANCIKCLSPPALAVALCFSIPYHALKMTALALTGNLRPALMVVIAYGRVMGDLGYLLGERRRVQGSRRVTDAELRRMGWLVPLGAVVSEWRRLRACRLM